MRTSLLLAALMSTVLLSSVANAADVTLTWTAPTANADGSVPALIGGYDVWVAPDDAALSALPDTLHGGKPAASAGNVLTYTFKNVPPGTYVYAVSTWACPTTGCIVSARSAHASTTVSAPVIVPGPPTNTKITVTVSAPGP
jgi:opacity protein-like surface antigen